MTKAERLPRRVVKLGGSLLDLPDLVERLTAWMDRQAAAESVLVVGGGALVEEIRRLDRIHRTQQDISHWLCIRAMAIQASFIAQMMPRVELCESVDVLRTAARVNRLLIVDPWRFMRDELRLSPTPLPESWDVTSDSIAARLAHLIAADELVLLKSTLPKVRSIATVDALMNSGYIDPYFARALVSAMPIRCVNLRADWFEEMTIEQWSD